jgi:hypothetical protein
MLGKKLFFALLIFMLTVLFAPFVSQRAANAADKLLFCNNPERITAPGTHADTMLRAGETYTIFFHYSNKTRDRGNLVLALSGDAGTPLRFSARRGFAEAHRDPTIAGRQAMARFLSAPTKSYSGKKGGAHFAMSVGSRQTASGVVTVTAKSDARLRIYWRHNKWTVPGARVVAIDSPRREVDVLLTKGEINRHRIGVPEAGMSKHLDGTYGMMYSFKVDAPVGSRVRVSFSPRGGHAGMVASVNGSLHQTGIIPATRWKVFCEAVVGANGLTLTTSPFGGVFYPVELVFKII